MKTYTLRDFNKLRSRIFKEAEGEVVQITKQGKPYLLLHSVDCSYISKVESEPVATLEDSKLDRAREVLRQAEAKSAHLGLGVEPEEVVEEVIEEVRYIWSEGESVSVSLPQWLKKGLKEAAWKKLPKQVGV